MIDRNELTRRSGLIREWIGTDTYKLVMAEIDDLKGLWLAQTGSDQYQDAKLANKAQALSDLTDRLQWYMDELARLVESEREAAEEPKTSTLTGRLPPRPRPHTV